MNAPSLATFSAGRTDDTTINVLRFILDRTEESFRQQFTFTRSFLRRERTSQPVQSPTLSLFYRRESDHLPNLESTGFQQAFRRAISFPGHLSRGKVESMPAKVACASFIENTPSAASCGEVHSLAPFGLRHTQMQQSGLRSLVPPKMKRQDPRFFNSTMVAP